MEWNGKDKSRGKKDPENRTVLKKQLQNIKVH